MTKPDPYATEEETQAVLKRGRDFRYERMNRSDMVPVPEFARLCGVSRYTVYNHIKKKLLIGVAVPGLGMRLPRWQLIPDIKNIVPLLFTDLDTEDGWTVLTYLESHLECLDATPREVLARACVDRTRIRNAAAAQSH